MSRSASIWALVALCGLAVGCVPLPKKSVVHYGVQGKLIDSGSGVPIGKSHLSIVVDGREFERKTNRRGEFTVAPEMHYFWTWLGGPMWMDATSATVEISLDGYAPYRRDFHVRSLSSDTPVAADKDKLQESYIVIGDIEMKKREQDAAGNSRHASQ